MSLVRAWDKDTGVEYPGLVSDHIIGHPILGVNLTGEPPNTAPESLTAPNKPVGGSSLPKSGRKKKTEAGITAEITKEG